MWDGSWAWDYLWRLHGWNVQGLTMNLASQTLPRALNMRDAEYLYHKFNEFEDHIPTERR